MKKSEKKAEKNVLQVQKRTIFGKKNKKLREKGRIPANIFGSNFSSLSIDLLYSDLVKTHKQTGETGIIYLALDKQEIPTLIKDIQRDPLHNHILHVDFRKVDLDKKIEAEVPLHFVGVSPAVNQGGVLLTQTEKLLVEALPQYIPHHIEIDLTSLTEVGNQIKVGQVQKNDAYIIKTEPEKVIVSVTAHKEESIVAETTAAAAPEVLTAKPEEGVQAEAAPAEVKTAEAQAPKKEDK